MPTVKQYAVGGILWSGIERFSVQGLQFVFFILIARLIGPADYGVAALITVFIALSQALIDSGFSNALMRKVERVPADYVAVFYFNVAASCVLAMAVVALSGPLAHLYKAPSLVPVLRVSSINLLLIALGAVQRTVLTIELKFKHIAKASIIASFASGVTGLVLSMLGFGVWALVHLTIVNNAVATLVLWLVSDWRPAGRFSAKALRGMFPFGSRLLLSTLLDTAYQNIYKLVIGARYSQQDLAYYARADQFCAFPSANLAGIIGRVSYPILCSIRDDAALRNAYGKLLRMSAFIVLPLMLVLAAVAHKFVEAILGKAWLESVKYLRILCFSYMLYPLHAINLNALLVKGRSATYFRIEVAKKVIGLTALFATLKYGVLAMCLGIVGTSFVALVINTWFSKDAMGYPFGRQVLDILPSAASAIVSGVAAYVAVTCVPGVVLGLCSGVAAGFAVYAVCSIVSGSEEVKELRGMALTWLARVRPGKSGSRGAADR